jgi:hypothetical protein
MSLLAILLCTGTMTLSLWATIRVRQVYNRFSLVPASSGSTGADTAATILRQEGFPTWRSWHTIRCSVITMTRYTSGSCSLAKIFTERRWRPQGYCGTRVRSCHPTQGSLCAFAMADGLGGSDSLCQPDRTLAALAGDVHRVLEHGYGIDPNGERLGHFDAV